MWVLVVAIIWMIEKMKETQDIFFIEHKLRSMKVVDIVIELQFDNEIQDEGNRLLNVDL
jgi:hypothetical protein